MALALGSRIGPYEISAQIGVGGMGEVYRAQDTKLKRQVAVKVLPESVAQDAERLARFQREAEVLAQLNHPNIAAIYGLEETGDAKALVMELVEGPTLADRIAQGPIPVDEALPIARQIAEALEAAHEQGIIHRDLKPANIKLRPDGTVKVLDFGLAKAMEPTGAMSSSVSMSPTITTPAMTQAGMILGTAAYMSPEQAKGRPADRRSDMWAFGAVLYEMLTGQRAFEAEDVSETLVAVLRVDVDLERLASHASPRIVTVVRRCLQKDPRERIHDAGDVRLALEGAFEPTGGTPSVAGSVSSPAWRRALPFVVVGVVAVIVTSVASLALRSVSSPRPVVRSVHQLPEGRNFRNTGRTGVAMAPTGQAFVYNTGGGLYLRRLDTLEARVIPGTEPALANPVFSPDGQSVAFYLNGGLRRLPVAGGTPVTLTPVADNTWGISWEPDGTLLYGQPDGIWQVSENGGEPRLLIATEEGEQASSPQRLPGGNWILFTLGRVGATGAVPWDQAEIVAESLTSGERRVLRTGGGAGRYISTGHLVYALQNVLFAVPFDVDRVAVTGGPVPVVQGVRRAITTADAFVAFAEDGTLVYVPGNTFGSETVTFAISDRAGQETRLSVPEGLYDYPRVSPDGRWVAFTATYSDGDDIAVYELGTDTAPRRLTFGGVGRFPIWSADSARVLYQSGRDGAPSLYWQAADGTGAAERLTTAEEGKSHIPDSVSPDGERVSFTVDSGQEAAVWVLTLQSKEAQPLVAEPGAQVAQSVFSPDGRWLTYQSNETGEDEIFVQPFPPTGAKYQLPNTRDNHYPLWSPDGSELFYTPGPGLRAAVRITTQPRFTFGNPVSLNLGSLLSGPPSTRRRHDIMPDGSGFLGTVPAGGEAGLAVDLTSIRIVEGWFEELQRLVPTN